MNQPIEPSCGEVRDACAEYALGLLPADERAGLARHIMGCQECRIEVGEMTALGDELIDLVPDAGPPAGFDRRVLAVIRQAGGSWEDKSRRPDRRKRFVVAGLVAAAAVAVIVGLAVRGGSGKSHHEITAALTADGHTIGSVYTEGHPTWIWMSVNGASVSGSVTCELLERDGQVISLGTFDLVKGSGSWAAPEPANSSAFSGARLVTTDGVVIASATFSR